MDIRSAKACLMLLAVAFIWLMARPDAGLAENLHMYINNQSAEELDFHIQVGVDEWPDTIAAGTTSGNIQANHSGGGGDGEITYRTKQRPVCQITLVFGYEHNATTGKCDKKTFDPVAKGSCSLAQTTCGGDGDCECYFDFNTTSN
jgi:hypothetical protein